MLEIVINYGDVFFPVPFPPSLLVFADFGPILVKEMSKFFDKIEVGEVTLNF